MARRSTGNVPLSQMWGNGVGGLKGVGHGEGPMVGWTEGRRWHVGWLQWLHKVGHQRCVGKWGQTVTNAVP